MRLIDADALNDVVMRLNAKGDSGITRSEYKLIDSVLFEFPTIDAEPVRRGRWIMSPKTQDGYCSECKCDMPVMMDDWQYKSVATNYCPNCGAKMDEGDEDEID